MCVLCGGEAVVLVNWALKVGSVFIFSLIEDSKVWNCSFSSGVPWRVTEFMVRIASVIDLHRAGGHVNGS